MPHDQLSREQADALREQVAAMLNQLGRERRRLERAGIDPADPVMVAMNDAWGRLQELHVRCHYASCSPGHAGK